ncbi:MULTISPECIES: MFS transporter [unclassified Pseudomonas]|uniref:MFS transporter n=1 Tax=unclassified Pseudomonas TaxID=196821 RepID=UPI000BCA225F|nr:MULTISPECIES: MFS transporter [unclassified Pseudomonas]PVZ20533.1 nitrate/nitrite transporter NarK [Pseudomonas sp. URIL14HWK12:I12]PVZ27599.1 nitrate/nitrite transporter NarK [Pseudomonas sp. URIL14HWK12:I10]PVZ38488.1 nitrate/nitrite transporter NarK [Pseudomonas sp. URIL14HWK12:I11]SNZ03157.1 Nitrate/nitrite transporter NarK [Pseudomonas sp. URIL14HWK12:I9]
MTPQPLAATAPLTDAEGEKLLRRVLMRIVPFIFLCYVISYLDRTNVGFAAIGMNKDLGLTATMFGWAAGLFFFGYFIFEIPSNLLMQRFGARIWIARIMITWGLVSMATAFVTGPVSFSIARFLLGLAEAGFTPGVYLYFTYWFPGKWRAKATAAFLLGIPVANIIGSPVSGWLLDVHGVMGLQSWQLLLILEALPAVLLGIVCLFVLVDTPAKARWLSEREKAWLAERLAREQQSISASHGNTLRGALTNPKVFILAAINFCCIVGSVGIGLWMPQIIKSMGWANSMVGLVAALPYLFGAVAMTLWARLANRARHRLRYVVSALTLAALALVASALLSDPVLKITALGLAVASILAFQATFWAIPSTFLTGRAAAGGLALIVSIGNLGGFAGPFLIGLIKDMTQSFTGPFFCVAAILAIGTLLMVWLGDPSKKVATPGQSPGLETSSHRP